MQVARQSALLVTAISLATIQSTACGNLHTHDTVERRFGDKRKPERAI
jgi:hypothetical protein